MMPVIGATPKFNLAAAVNPGVNDDEAMGYTVGSQWVNASANAVFTCTDSTPGAAVWMNTTGDAQGPASSLDLEVAVFSGTGGKTLAGSGVRNYGAAAVDPASPTPQAGDTYYNTAINHQMVYDGTRSKWLSVATLTEGSGRNGNTGAGSFYRRFDGMILAAAQGPFAPNGTIVYMGFSTNIAVSHTVEVLVGGVVIASLASGGAAFASDATLNADFNAGIMSVRSAVGSATTNDMQLTIYYKLRP